MREKRKNPSHNQQLMLFSEVNGMCPLCTKQLTYQTKKQINKCFEVAHIYPLNSNKQELNILKDVEVLFNKTVNDIENLIALCSDCHIKFDKPRTRVGYQKLYEIKKKLIAKKESEAIFEEYKLEDEISEIIDSLVNENSKTLELNFDAKAINEKLNTDFCSLTKEKIKFYVENYFQKIKNRIKKLGKAKCTIPDLICSQVRTFYIAQKNLEINQMQIFDSICNWINLKTESKNQTAAEIVAAFFIQNCEIF